MKGSFALFAVAALACATYPAAGSAADDTAALRAELDALKSEYDARVAALEARIGQLESAAVAAVPAPAVPDVSPGVDAAPAAPGSTATAFNPAMSAILGGSYANLSEDPATYRIAGFLPAGDEIGPGDRSFNLGESELTLSANIDPYFMGSLTFAMTPEDEIEVEEAFFRTLALPSGFTLKGGRFFSGFGYLNEFHAHAWDFVDQPLVYQAFFGGQRAQDGVQLKWLAPTDLFLELGAESGNGDAFPGYAARRQRPERHDALRARRRRRRRVGELACGRLLARPARRGTRLRGRRRARQRGRERVYRRLAHVDRGRDLQMDPPGRPAAPLASSCRAST